MGADQRSTMVRTPAPWLALAALSAAVTGCSALTGRVPSVCQGFPLCSPAVSTSTPINLAAARQAAKQLQEATHLRSYRRAAEALNRELIQLREGPLSPGEKREVDRLTSLNRTAQIVVLEETKAQAILDRASDAITAASRLRGADQQRQLAQAKDLLVQIPGRSFADERSRRLMQELEGLMAQSELEVPKDPVEEPSKVGDPVAPPQPALPPPSQGDVQGSQPDGWWDKPLF